MKSAADKRKTVRRTISYPAYLDFGDGAPARDCTLCDASQEGAQLAVAEPDKVPEEFILALSADGAARRRCRVMWRTDNQIGVEFLKEIKKSPQPFRMPPARPVVAEAAASAEETPEVPKPVEDTVDIDTLQRR